jgi:hypothetical protein
LHNHAAALLAQIHAEPRTVTEVVPEPAGPQGYSGSEVGYYRVASTDPRGAACHDRLVVKQASLQERRITALLTTQGCAVPPAVIPDLEAEGRAPIYMPYLEPRPPYAEGHGSPLTESIAEGLAGIHAANRCRPPAWLPHTARDFHDQLWLRAWREKWRANLAQPAFAAEFGRYTQRLQAADEQLLRDLAALTAEATSLTLLNVDLIPDHIRLWRGRACFIDWEQSSYGTLYLDLPNAFNVETALAYRDALARHGHAIPETEFFERFHAVSPYMGLRYLGYSLWQWEQGGAERERGRWFLYYCLHLALHGR